MKKTHIFLTLLLTVCLFALNSCQKTETITTETATTETVTNDALSTDLKDSDLALRSNNAHDAGAVFVMDNAVAGNNILIYRRAATGLLTKIGSIATGGKGTGGGLGSQNALLKKGDLLYACNAGSNDITLFKINGFHLKQLDKVASHGTQPISVTAFGNWVYVLNGGGNGNISGFKRDYYGHLTYIANSERPLSLITTFKSSTIAL